MTQICTQSQKKIINRRAHGSCDLMPLYITCDFKELTVKWLKAQIWAESDSEAETSGLWTIFSLLSITVRAPAVIYVKQFVWITLALTVSCLFSTPRRSAKYFTPALESQLHECSRNKGNGCGGKITGNIGVCNYMMLRRLAPGCRAWVLKVLKLKAPPDIHHNTCPACCSVSLFTDFFELTRTVLRKRECEWKITQRLNL